MWSPSTQVQCGQRCGTAAFVKTGEEDISSPTFSPLRQRTATVDSEQCIHPLSPPHSPMSPIRGLEESFAGHTLADNRLQSEEQTHMFKGLSRSKSGQRSSSAHFPQSTSLQISKNEVEGTLTNLMNTIEDVHKLLDDPSQNVAFKQAIQSYILNAAKAVCKKVGMQKREKHLDDRHCAIENGASQRDLSALRAPSPSTSSFLKEQSQLHETPSCLAVSAPEIESESSQQDGLQPPSPSTAAIAKEKPQLNKNKKPSCPVCHFELRNNKPSTLKEHMQTHDDSRDPCSVCGKEVKANCLAKHMKKCNKIPVTRYACSLCTKTLASRTALARHVKTKHPSK